MAADLEPLAPGLVEALERPEAYSPGVGAAPVAGIEAIQTHISYVFLTADRVYKVRKAVELPFLDYSTRALRNLDCLNEVALNRRLAPDVYLGVAPIRPGAEGFRVGAPAESLQAPIEGETPEHCVVMRRLPDGRDALTLVRNGALQPRHVDAVAARLAAFHERVGLGTPAPWDPAEWLERVRRPVRESFRLARESGCAALPLARLDALEKRADARLAAARARFEQRRGEGRVVDGHGDVHLDHVWFETDEAEPLLIDCIAFDAELRRIDRAAELAFLSMDLEYRGRRDLAGRLLSTYASATDDYGLYGVVDYHVAHRALVRASVAGIAAAETEIAPDQREAAAESASAHLALAERTLARSAVGGAIVVCGSVGVGKSSAAAVAADAVGGVVLSSDRIRKRLAGLPDRAHTAAAEGRGLYAPDRVAVVYDALLERAGPVVDSGRVAILDATFGLRGRRDAVREWGRARGVPVRLLEVHCPADVARERVARRQQEGSDPSDAGPERVDRSREVFEPPVEWAEGERWRVDTSRPSWRDELRRLVRPPG